MMNKQFFCFNFKGKLKVGLVSKYSTFFLRGKKYEGGPRSLTIFIVRSGDLVHD